MLILAFIAFLSNTPFCYLNIPLNFKSILINNPLVIFKGSDGDVVGGIKLALTLALFVVGNKKIATPYSLLCNLCDVKL